MLLQPQKSLRLPLSLSSQWSSQSLLLPLFNAHVTSAELNAAINAPINAPATILIYISQCQHFHCYHHLGHKSQNSHLFSRLRFNSELQVQLQLRSWNFEINVNLLNLKLWGSSFKMQVILFPIKNESVFFFIKIFLLFCGMVELRICT